MSSARIARVLVAAALGVSCAALASCGGSGGKLIPVADAGSLQGDFETVARAAENAGGDCTTTEGALLKTEQDFAALPASVDTGLRERMHEGITKLREDALGLCENQSSSTGTQKSTSTGKTTPTTSTPTTSTSTTETQTTPSTPSTPSTPTTTVPTTGGTGGGTPAEPEETSPGTGQAGGTGAGEDEGAANGVGPGGTGPPGQQEGTKP